MKNFLNIIKYDYLQRTRSYGFLITLYISLAVAYSFVPEPNASYSTIRVGDYLGYYNSAWFGNVTAIMTSTFLSLIGFYLINSGIKTDVETKVGQIMAATPIKNLTYLLSKTMSNFLVLLTIALLVFLMSIVLFFLYHDPGYSLEVWQFITPYLFITLPALFFVSALAVLSEVLLGRFSILQNVGFFFLFTALMANTTFSTKLNFPLDVIGSKIVIHHMEEKVHSLSGNDDKKDLTIGYVLGNTGISKKFEFTGVDFPPTFVLSRFAWILLSIALVVLISPLFHRFNFRKPFAIKKRKRHIDNQRTTNHITLSKLPPPQTDFGVLPLLKTELLLLFRHGKKWMWLLNLAGMVFLALLPLEMAHQMALPILWFLQVGRLSTLTSKEFLNNVHYFSFSSYRPLTRMLLSQVLAAGLILILLASPLIIRYGITGDLLMIAAIFLGGFGIVLLASVIGMLTKGKKLFEVLFFMISYANINGIPFLDYFGGFNRSVTYVFSMAFLVLVLSSLCILLRTHQLRR